MNTETVSPRSRSHSKCPLWPPRSCSVSSLVRTKSVKKRAEIDPDRLPEHDATLHPIALIDSALLGFWAATELQQGAERVTPGQ